MTSGTDWQWAGAPGETIIEMIEKGLIVGHPFRSAGADDVRPGGVEGYAAGTERSDLQRFDRVFWINVTVIRNLGVIFRILGSASQNRPFRPSRYPQEAAAG